MPQWHFPTSSRDTRSDAAGGPLSRRALFAATAVGVPVVAVVAGTLPAAANPSVTGGDTRIVDVPLSDAPIVDADGLQVRDLPGHLATMAGATWSADAAEPLVHARGLLEDGTWTEWFELETALDPETGDRAPGTELAWLGNVTGLQMRAEVDGMDVTDEVTAHVVTTSPLDADASVGDLSGPTATQPQSRQITPQASATATNPATPVLGPGAPTYITRASWGADESSTRSTSASRQLKAVIIHHTAGTNSYSSSQSAQIVRGIHSYHTRTLGWADTGYNILVDKYGRIFEGRSGGLHRNVIGAHAFGFNTSSFGISVLGDYTSTTVPAAARDAVSRIVGWKLLNTFHTSAWDKATWTPGTGTRFTPDKPISLARVMGHRDVNYTACPGARLYSQFDRIRGDAQRHIDRGWRVHLTAFQRAGGESSLGTVVRSAHQNGKYWATELSKGLVLSEGNGGATGYATPFASSWRSAWGRPVRNASKDGDRTIQPFQHGTAALEGSAARFVTPSFRDVAPARVFYLEIEDLAARGITTGWGDRTFRPDNDNLRDAMIVFIYRALGSPAYTAPRNSPFRDVDPGFVFYRELCWAYEAGIARGWADGTFRPLEPVKRDSVAAFLYRAAGEPAASRADSAQFKDVGDDVIFAKEIGWLARTGISRGWADGTFRPYANIKRDQMATFVMRWMVQTGRA
ncbi:hypothetical protein JOD52_002437 [Brachybacterium muris]|nr:S-layer homology domain-containing protein [Brachybacterium muris]MBM7501597.1 hypothetical protein [Brachybacterium muris]